MEKNDDDPIKREDLPIVRSHDTFLTPTNTPLKQVTPLSTPDVKSRSASPSAESDLADAFHSLDLQRSRPSRDDSPAIPGAYPRSPAPSSVKEESPETDATESLPRSPSPNVPQRSPSRTAFLYQDACFGHRYIRNRHTSDIVERPERLRAIKVGAAAAHASLSIDDGKPFDVVNSTRKSTLEADHDLRLIHGQDWPSLFTTLSRDSTAKIQAGGSEIPSDYSQGDLYLSPGSADAVAGSLGASYDAIDRLMSSEYDSILASIRPPGHHCGKDSPSGFCFFNNVAVALQYAYRVHNVTRVAVLDIDLHHGNGTQAIVWELNNARQQALAAARAQAAVSKSPRPQALSTPPSSPHTMYASLHDILSYPCEDGDPTLVRDASVRISGAHGQWIWNVHLKHYNTFDEFTTIYENEYSTILDQAEKFFAQPLQPGEEPGSSLVIISAGFDASEHEYPSMQRHGLKVPTQFYDMFAKDVKRRLADPFCGGKVLAVVEGGYSDRALMTGAGSLLRGLSRESKAELPSWELDMSTVQLLEKAVLAVKRPRPTSRSSLPLDPRIAAFVDNTRSTADSLFALTAESNLPPPKTPAAKIEASIPMTTRLRTRKPADTPTSSPKPGPIRKSHNHIHDKAAPRSQSAYTTPVNQNIQDCIVIPATEPVTFQPKAEANDLLNVPRETQDIIMSEDEDEAGDDSRPQTPTPAQRNNGPSAQPTVASSTYATVF